MKRAFTLVELLIVVAIIGVLASVTLMALSQAQGQAKIYRTQTTIAKIDAALAEVYERFEFRAKSKWIDPCPAIPPSIQCLAHPNNKAKRRSNANLARYLILREEMRLEMPQLGLALAATSSSFITNIVNNDGVTCPVHSYAASLENALALDLAGDSDVVKVYREAIAAAGAVPAAATSSEFLYLVIETSNPEAIANFKGGEIGDTDGDGLFEFIDAWGNPIRYLRFAPGLQDSQRQPVIPRSIVEPWVTSWSMRTGPLDPVEIATFTTGIVELAIDKTKPDFLFAEKYPDPLYPQRAGNTNLVLRSQWLTFPVIYSLGADGVAGIVEGPVPPGNPPPATDASALVPISPTNIILGAPDGTGYDRDNVTNHNMTRPF